MLSHSFSQPHNCPSAILGIEDYPFCLPHVDPSLLLRGVVLLPFYTGLLLLSTLNWGTSHTSALQAQERNRAAVGKHLNHKRAKRFHNLNMDRSRTWDCVTLSR